VLLADDDADARAVTRTMLEEVGHDVVEADGSAATLAAMGREGGLVDALIVDFAMPGMNGVELVREARRLWPAIPVVFITGFADTAALRAYAASDELLEKPFRAAELAAKVAGALDRRPSAGRADQRA
jgi:CheY-like chemotaxis protein